MILKEASNVYFGSNVVKKMYIADKLVYNYVTSSPPIVSEDDMLGSNFAESYEENSTSWGDFTLSDGCTISKDGIEVQNEQIYISTSISNLSYPMTFEFKGRVDSSGYKAQANSPAMLFGLGPTKNEWGSSITCYATTDYGIIIDTVSAMKITTNKTPTYVHIIFTINSSGTLTMYMNGISNVWTATSDSAITSNKTYIYNGEGNGRFVGAINTMRWWDVELSSSEIETLFSKDTDEYIL